MSEIQIEKALKFNNAVFIDVRSPKEYLESHIVGAINWPIFNDLERETVGKIYKANGKISAVNEGIDVVQGKLKDFFNKTIEYNEKYDAIIIYCSRGGMRSNTLYSFSQSIGVKNIYRIIDGYKAYRNYAINQSIEILKENPITVIHGRTGVGKTRILQELSKRDIPIIDLEDLAKNAGSVFGNIPFNDNPPTQKMFENLIFEKLRTLKRPIFVESESRRIGQVSLTNEFYDAMSRGKHILVETSIGNRINIIKQLYIQSLKDDKLIDSINHLKKRLGNEKTQQLVNLINNKEYGKVVELLLIDYYDPLYDYSIKRQKEFNLKINYDSINQAINLIEKYYYEVTYEK